MEIDEEENEEILSQNSNDSFVLNEENLISKAILSENSTIPLNIIEFE